MILIQKICSLFNVVWERQEFQRTEMSEELLETNEILEASHDKSLESRCGTCQNKIGLEPVRGRKMILITTSKNQVHFMHWKFFQDYRFDAME